MQVILMEKVVNLGVRHRDRVTHGRGRIEPAPVVVWISLCRSIKGLERIEFEVNDREESGALGVGHGSLVMVMPASVTLMNVAVLQSVSVRVALVRSAWARRARVK